MQYNQLIENLIETKKTSIAESQKESKAKAQEILNKAFADMRAFLGDFWTHIEERAGTEKKINVGQTWGNDNRSVELKLSIPADPELELAPMSFTWTREAPRSGYYGWGFKVMGSHFWDVPSALLAAREKYSEYVEKAREDAFKKFDKAVPHAWHRGEVDLSKIEEALSTLIKEWPELEERARTYVSEWKKSRAQYEKRTEEERVEREREEAEAKIRAEKLETYVRALAAHYKAVEEVEQKNRKIAEEIQTRADRAPYTVYKLNYALIGSIVEDGEEFRDIETREVYTFDEEPDEGKYWNINGKKIRFLHAFSVEKEEVYPSSGILAKRITRSSIDLYFHPQDPEEFVSEELKKISPLPEAPEIPGEISSRYDSRQLNRAAYALLKDESLSVEQAIEREHYSDYY